MQVDASELTREELLELQLAESRAREAQLSLALAQRNVQDASAELDRVKARLRDVVTARRAATEAQRGGDALLAEPASATTDGALAS